MIHLELEVGGVAHTVSAEADGDRFRVVVDGKERSVDARAFDGFFYSFLVDGRSHEATVEETPDGYRVQTGLHAIDVARLDPLRPAKGAGGGRHAGPLPIKAVMPGRVTRVLVTAGQQVEQGAPLLVLEAMKMENEVTAPRAGVVSRITANPGSTVETGAELLVLGEQA